MFIVIGGYGSNIKRLVKPCVIVRHFQLGLQWKSGTMLFCGLPLPTKET